MSDIFCSSLSSLLWISIFEELPQDALLQGGSQKLKVKSQKFCTRLLQGIGKRTWGQGEGKDLLQVLTFVPLLPLLLCSLLPSLLTMIKFIFVAIYAWQRLSIRHNTCVRSFCYGCVKVYQPQVKRSW